MASKRRGHLSSSFLPSFPLLFSALPNGLFVVKRERRGVFEESERGTETDRGWVRKSFG